MRKLIEVEKEYLIVCDNTSCDFKIPFDEELEEFTILFIDKPCPKCGENLLTKKDFLDHERLMAYVNWVNKWFSWITIFYSKKTLEAKRKKTTVHVHDGFKIKTED